MTFAWGLPNVASLLYSIVGKGGRRQSPSQRGASTASERGHIHSMMLLCLPYLLRRSPLAVPQARGAILCCIPFPMFPNAAAPLLACSLVCSLAYPLAAYFHKLYIILAKCLLRCAPVSPKPLTLNSTFSAVFLQRRGTRCWSGVSVGGTLAADVCAIGICGDALVHFQATIGLSVVSPVYLFSSLNGKEMSAFGVIIKERKSTSLLER